jgi:hypothetical protein
MPQNNFLKQKAQQYPRTTALLFAAFGAWLFYLSLLKPLAEAREGKQEIHFSVGFAAMGALVVVLALGFTLTGNRYAAFFKAPLNGDTKKVKYIFFGFCFVFGMVATYFIEHYLESMGYTVK